jgi:probable H4MPT-linked C1 transfer pathway protein
MAQVLGVDIGGANLKAAHTAGKARSRPFALWKAPERLADELLQVTDGCPPYDHLAITMTGELCDCFESKREGVNHILDAVEAVAGATPVHVWTNEAKFVSVAQARQEPYRVASANWLATATALGRLAPSGPALLIDVGTTTTDIIPLLDGRPVPKGRTDPERLRSGELVYLGWRRTPLCALLGTDRAAELFATTLDAYLVLKLVPENPSDRDTADGKQATRAAAHRRLARMLGADLESATLTECGKLAAEVNFKVIGRIALAVRDVAKSLPGPPRTVIACGSGEFLVHGVLSSILVDREVQSATVISMQKETGAAAEASASAVAWLCKEMVEA